MKRILLVEDTKALAENMSDILVNLGFDVTIASDGSEALGLLDEVKPAIIITDVLMPVMDGLELTRRVRANSGYRNVPIIILSARATDGDIAAGFAAGASDYLKKPCIIEDLISSIEKLSTR